MDGLDTQFLQQAEAQFGWENLVNKRSTTWRNLDENVKNTLDVYKRQRISSFSGKRRR